MLSQDLSLRKDMSGGIPLRVLRYCDVILANGLRLCVLDRQCSTAIRHAEEMVEKGRKVAVRSPDLGGYYVIYIDEKFCRPAPT